MKKSEEESTVDMCTGPEVELSEYPSEEYISQQSSESENEETKQPSEVEEEQTDDASGKTISQLSSDIESDLTEQPCEEPDEDPLEEYLSQPLSESDIDDNECHSESGSSNTKEKKRSLDVSAGDSGSLQVHRSRKKCKQEECIELEADTCSILTDLHNESGSPIAFVNAESTSEQQDHTGSSGKLRRSRDSLHEFGGEEGEGERKSKRRKTGWADEDSWLKMLGPIQLPDFINDIFTETDSDPEIQELRMKLLETNRRLQESEIHHDREKLVQDRQTIISKLIQKNPMFRPPSDFKPSKLYKKLYIPLREYPGYNFIGLIIGPRGNTQKRMEKESGARIVIRGKGSVRKKWAHQKPDSSDNDDLHVLVEADNQGSLDAAVNMVEKLLNPVDERMNKHKVAQLKELAELKGSLRDESLCRECGEQGHKQYACPTQKSTFEVDLFDVCWGSSLSVTNHPLTASTPVRNIEHQRHGFVDIQSGNLFLGTSPDIGSMQLEHSNCRLFTSPSYGHFSHSGVSPTPNTGSKSGIKVDDRNIYVGYLPQTVDNNQLRELFSPFGRIAAAKVIKDKSTGMSKGYGFVRYYDSTNAVAAAAHMQGQKIDGKTLVVRASGHFRKLRPSGIAFFQSTQDLQQ